MLLGGCETSTKLGDMLASKPANAPEASDPANDPFPSQAAASVAQEPTGSINRPEGVPQRDVHGLLGSDPNDDLSLGRKHYRAGNFALAEKHFRKAVESHPRDAEAWVGLAASYDKLRRFDLADRAYHQAALLVGETPELLNNIGYSHMLRGDYARARSAFLAAQAKDPGNPYVKNNLELLEKSFRQGKAIQ
jgi:tetratricopeptide (TPR) repeat protein